MLATDKKKWYQQFWPWFLITLPSAVIVACFYTVYIAVNHPLSMVKKDYYQEGLTINKNIAGLEKAVHLGLSASIHFDDKKQLRLEMNAREAMNETGGLVLFFYHPVDDGKDLSFQLYKQSDKVFVSETLTMQQWHLLSNEGRWYVQLRPMTADWVLEGEIVQPNFKNVRLDAHSG